MNFVFLAHHGGGDMCANAVFKKPREEKFGGCKSIHHRGIKIPIGKHLIAEKLLW